MNGPSLVTPHASYHVFPVNRPDSAPSESTVLSDPAHQFCIDRFKRLTVLQQADFLAQLAVQAQEVATTTGVVPAHIRAMRMSLEKGPQEVVTQAEALHYYLNFPADGLRDWLHEHMKDPAAKEQVLEKFYDVLRTQLPAIAYTLAHLYSGGYYGLLTAREDRNTHHLLQLEVISRTFGFAPQTELVYYVNDPVLGKRLKTLDGMSTAEKKATVLANFATGYKQTEEGRIAPMKLGSYFEKIIFIDDEDKNLKAVVQSLVYDVSKRTLRHIGVPFIDRSMEITLTKFAARMTEQGYTVGGAAIVDRIQFWSDVIGELLSEHPEFKDSRLKCDMVLADLKRSPRWLPDVIKVLDARTLSVEDSIAALRGVFHANRPITMGAKPWIVFNDIDRTILNVDARFPIRRKSDPQGRVIGIVTQAEFAENGNPAYWLAKVSEETGVPADDLDFGWDHFRDPKTIELDHLRCQYKGSIYNNPHATH